MSLVSFPLWGLVYKKYIRDYGNYKDNKVLYKNEFIAKTRQFIFNSLAATYPGIKTANSEPNLKKSKKQIFIINHKYS